ncbi:MAG: DUF3726 domain-containing protein [Acidimicrobiia bacterium]
MIVSFNELDATVRKAFRGAGYHWGEAEEAGKAALWLARNKIASASIALGLLKSTGGDVARFRPSPDRRSWSKEGSTLCPLLTGIMLADDAPRMVDGEHIDFAALHAPGFLLPFLGQLAGEAGLEFRLSLPRLDVTISAHAVSLSGPPDALAIPSSASISAFRRVAKSTPDFTARAYSTEVSSDDWDRLNDLAAKTYVPASDRSRSSGAGAGLVDSD